MFEENKQNSLHTNNHYIYTCVCASYWNLVFATTHVSDTFITITWLL